jgi:cob(I)alamin adenosyltransferase
VAKDRISKVTTRTGDGGQTKLATGKTVSKKQPIIRAIGSVDELNSHIGLTLTVLLANQNSIPNNVELTALQATFTGIQQALFDTGAVLAMEGDFTPPDCAVIEASTETFNSSLPPLSEFVLPGGNLPSAHLHVCRTVCRRAETDLWELVSEGAGSTEGYKHCARYLNRLSDFFFVLARAVNNVDETQWSGPKQGD